MKKVRVGVIGCGMISEMYLKNMTGMFGSVLHVQACADLSDEAAAKRADQFGIKVMTVRNLIDDPEIEIVVNLTIPSAHYEISKAALLTGKHVYSEKPLAETMEQGHDLVRLAKEKKLLLAAAPDTFLGAGFRTCREIIDSGEIGEPVGAFGFMLARGPESFHPNPAFFYQPGGGPLLDMGPYYFTALTSLLGEAKRVTGISKCQTPTRTVQNQNSPHYNTEFPCEADSFSAALVEFGNGVIANVTTTWDLSFPYWESGMPLLLIHGSKGALTLPDPNMFGGIAPSPFGAEPGKFVLLRKGTEQAVEVPVKEEFRQNSRGLGPADLALSLRIGEKPSVTGEMSLHVLEIMLGALQSSQTNQTYKLQTSCERPKTLSSALVDIGRK